MKIGDTIYHESRYWKQDNLSADEVPGWNARYLPYLVTKVTDKTIFATGCGPDNKASHVQFSRSLKQKPGHARPTTLEGDGKQYHWRFHEYFYTEEPKRERRQPRVPFAPQTDAAALLGLRAPYSADDVRRAFKRLAPKYHPDGGGSHEGFIKLKRAHDEAMRGAGLLTGAQTVSGKWHCSCGASMDLRMSGMWGGVGTQLIETFLSQHRAIGHRLTQTA